VVGLFGEAIEELCAIVERTLTAAEASTLLYLETCLVDKAGRVESRRMNDEEHSWCKLMSEEKFIEFGRIVIKDHNRDGDHWVRFTTEAWELAHRLRRERADRILLREPYRRTCDKHN
jgi:hypothetical protein